MRKKTDTKEKALLALINNKEEGLYYFFNLYYEPISYFISKLVKDGSVAEEITADVFNKFWTDRNMLSTDGSVKALLYKMARNRAIDHLRKEKRMAVRKEGLHYYSPAPDKTILQTLVETETIQHIVHTLQSLPPKCSQVFKLSYLLGRTDKEIALELNLSPHTVRNQKLRALRLLKQRVSFFILLTVSFIF